MTAVCLLLAPTHRFGGIYLVSATMSLLLIAASVWGYERGGRRGGIAIAGICLILSGLLMLGIVALHALVNLIGCVACAILHARRPTLVIVLFALAAAVYGYVLYESVDTVRELEAMKRKHPFESLVARLAYETDEYGTGSPTLGESQNFNGLVLTNLKNFEDRSPITVHRREWALQAIHERTTQQFAAAAGFGAVRMLTVRPEMAELPPRVNMRLPLKIVGVESDAQPAELQSLHGDVMLDFLAPERFGYVRNRDAVAGFESHGFSMLADTPAGDEASNWQVSRLELVSLLRHDEPRVYVAETLPQMDQLEEIPHRALDKFEQQSLPKLHYDEDLVVDPSADRIVMLGSVRAGNDCLQCHEGTRGKLLGAFSYELTRVE